LNKKKYEKITKRYSYKEKITPHEKEMVLRRCYDYEDLRWYSLGEDARLLLKWLAREMVLSTDRNGLPLESELK